ncbi:MAG: histidine kinase N-terminal 7TM domain-containing protein [Chloroflexota bacterium]|nr:histidine kinase N-terminal 7TM domain-containing protein [Chloroflexota bacterium]
MTDMVAPLLILNQILTAGNTITAFSLLLYALTFNMRERVARSLAVLLACVTIVYFGDVLVATTNSPAEAEVWLRLQWLGISFVPAAYLQLSDALLAATGRPSRGRRSRLVGLSYLLSGLTLAGVAFSQLIAAEVVISESVVYLRPGPLFPLFSLFLLINLILAGYNFWRAYKRCLTRSSKRRMRYLLAGSIGPLIAAYPWVMLGGSSLISQGVLFWGILIVINIFVAVQLVLMSYAVAYFGVEIPDRVVKARLFQWIIRGPFVASTVLALTVIVNRLAEMFGYENSRIVPFTTVASILILQYLITLVRRPVELWFFYGEDRGDVARLQLLEERLLTSGDLRQFLESILNAICDLLGSDSAFVALVGSEGLELEVAVGSEDPLRGSKDLPPLMVTDNRQEFDILGDVFSWDVFWLIPLRLANPAEVIGFLGLKARGPVPDFTQEEEENLSTLLERATIALTERKLQREVFAIVDRLVPQAQTIQRIRAEARYAGSDALTAPVEGIGSEEELTELVREALGHYWGGPRLTSSPLLGLRVVRRAMDEHEGNPVNALRATLRHAIDQVRPEGERRFTAEWMLYNILEMKFLQGRKVRDVAMKLAMSEADLYRKQRVAIEAVAESIANMERGAVASEEVVAQRTE